MMTGMEKENNSQSMNELMGRNKFYVASKARDTVSVIWLIWLFDLVSY